MFSLILKGLSWFLNEDEGWVINGMENIDKIKMGDGPNGSVENPDKILSISIIK